MPTSTSSFRIDSELKLRLELAARRTNHGKNWIINQALNEYLSHHGESDLQAEARRQSLEAARHSSKMKNADAWERSAAEVWND
jgi:predicted transcriptional regulator